MDTAIWVLQGLLGVAFLGAGMMKLMKGHEALKSDPKMAWANDFSGGFIRFIAAAEVVGGLGLILPGLVGIAPILTPIAAAGLAIIMVGATATHIRRSEGSAVVPTLVLAVLSAFVAYGRFVMLPLS